jgi:mono/diheme cytochrome c family protein
MYKRLIWILPMLLTAKEDFISHFEYGQMLYNNPRGVSCAACHGKLGEGSVIARYKDEKGQTHLLRAPDIRTLRFERFYYPFTPEGHSRKDIMPQYYLTKKEIRTIYDYIVSINRKLKGKKDE